MTDAPTRQDAPEDGDGRQASDPAAPAPETPQWADQQPPPAPWMLGRPGAAPPPWPPAAVPQTQPMPPMPWPPTPPQGQGPYQQYPPVPPGQYPPAQYPPGQPGQYPPGQYPPGQPPQGLAPGQGPVQWPGYPPPPQQQGQVQGQGQGQDQGQGQGQNGGGQAAGPQQQGQPGQFGAPGAPVQPGQPNPGQQSPGQPNPGQQSPGQQSPGQPGQPPQQGAVPPWTGQAPPNPEQPVGGQPPSPWQDPGQYGRFGGGPPQGPRPPYQPQRPPQQRQNRPDPQERPQLDLRTRWARGLGFGAMVCVLVALYQGLNDFPLILVGAGVALIMSVAALWFGAFAQRDASRTGRRSPATVSAIVWACVSALFSLILCAVMLADYPDLRQYSDCMRDALTISAQNECQSQLKNSELNMVASR